MSKKQYIFHLFSTHFIKVNAFRICSSFYFILNFSTFHFEQKEANIFSGELVYSIKFEITVEKRKAKNYVQKYVSPSCMLCCVMLCRRKEKRTINTQDTWQNKKRAENDVYETENVSTKHERSPLINLIIEKKGNTIRFNWYGAYGELVYVSAMYRQRHGKIYKKR